MKRHEPSKEPAERKRGNSIPLEDWQLEDVAGGVTPKTSGPVPIPYPNTK